MSRMPWRNESRICRWPDGGFGSSGPSREEKLRKKYPDLQKAWKKYTRYATKIADTKLDLKKSRAANKKYQKAKKDYKFLEKMLWDY